MAVVGQQLLVPESGWRRLYYDNPHLKYVGTWVVDTTTTYSERGRTYSNTAGSTIKFLFKGTKLRYLGQGWFDSTTLAYVTIDGVQETFNENYPAQIKQCLFYEKTGLSNDYHVVEIGYINNDGYITFEAIDIDEDGELIRHNYLDNLPYDELTRKYGVAWFGFDEASGNVYDKLGSNHVGTLVGATRVTGWNGEGYALEFGATNKYVDLNFMLPMGEKTLRMKFKPNSATTGLLFSNMKNAITNGIQIPVNNNTITLQVFKNGATLSTMEAQKVLPNKWNDLIISFNKEDITVFLNNEKVLFGKGLTNHSLETYNGTIGLQGGRVLPFFGQIDDFQVYSKALTPSDFTQHRVAMKTTDNKTITLPNGEGRVKELPTADEVDLINQGYTWREIDNAVDSTRYDLTQATTEYEITSKSNSPLGTGKLFTLPIKEEFKTVKIENNF